MVPPRSEAQREKERPGYGNAALPDSGHEHREPDAARVTGEGPGKGPRARALLSARLLHHFRRSAAGRIHSSLLRLSCVLEEADCREL